MGSSYRGLRRVASFRPYTSKQVGDTGPADSERRSNSHAFGSSFSGAHGTTISDCLHPKVNFKTKINLYVNFTTQRYIKKIFKIFLFTTGINDTGGAP